jgi:hypothetical protein
MQFAFGFLLFLVGFAMLLGGIGLLIGGEIKLKNGKTIPKIPGRKAGIALVSFFPLIGIGLFILRQLDTEGTVAKEAITWPLALICLGLAGFWVWRGMNPRLPKALVLTPAPFFSEPQQSPGATPAQLEFDMPAEPFPATTPPAQPSRKQPRGGNPFDFS